jgi:hypothetical protein
MKLTSDLISSKSLSSSTLIDSTPGVLVAWDGFGREYGFDGATAAHEGHGRRLAETLGERCNLKTPDQIAVRPVPSSPKPRAAELATYAHACICHLYQKKKTRPPLCVSSRLSLKADRSRSQVRKRYSHRSPRAVRRPPADGPS